MSAAAPADLSAYDRLRWNAAELEALLAGGQHRRELLAYFGAHDFRRLTLLARRAAAWPAPAARPRVYVIPGIMGSELGRTRPAPWPADLLWLDPLDIIGGRLIELDLDSGIPLEPLGVLPPTYAPLQLELRAAGCDVVLHAYDWRRSILETGRDLGARLAADPAEQIHVIAHSMGGLLARVALASAPLARVVRLITVGTPHAGTFAPLQALRGTYPVVRRLAALDRRHDAETLAANVFSSFPSLYEMLPTAASGCAVDVFEPGNWPQRGPRRARPGCRRRAVSSARWHRSMHAAWRSSASASAPSPALCAPARSSPTRSPARGMARCRCAVLHPPVCAAIISVASIAICCAARRWPVRSSSWCGAAAPAYCRARQRRSAMRR